MGYAIEVTDDNAPIPYPLRLVLACDEPAHAMVRRIFAEGSIDDWYSAARREGWGIRVGDEARTLCKFCYADYLRERARKQAERLRVNEDAQPKQFVLL